MKVRVLVIVLLAVAFVGAPAMFGYASAADKTLISGTETFDPFGLLGPPVGQILDLGTVQCPGQEPTGDPLQPCPLGSRTHIRGFTFVSRVDSLDPSLGGEMTVVLNANFDADSTGPAWGTFSLALDAGGVWDGTFEGRRRRVGDHWVLPLHVSGRGTGGAIDGAHLMAVDVITISTPAPVAYTGEIEGRVVDPHAN